MYLQLLFHLVKFALYLRYNGPMGFSVVCQVNPDLLKLYYDREDELTYSWAILQMHTFIQSE